VDYHQSLAYHVAYHHLGNRDDALDACQEAMLAAWRALQGFRGDADNFRRWLVKIVVNSCHDRQRYERRRPHVPIEVDDDGERRVLPLPDLGESPESYAERGDLRTLLEQALSRLSEDHRTVILLDHTGHSYAEMANILDVEVGTVKSRLCRARAHMRDMLTGRTGPDAATEPEASARRSYNTPPAAARRPAAGRGDDQAQTGTP